MHAGTSCWTLISLRSASKNSMFIAAEAQPAAALDRSAEVLLLRDQPQPYGPPALREEVGPPASLGGPAEVQP